MDKTGNFSCSDGPPIHYCGREMGLARGGRNMEYHCSAGASFPRFLTVLNPGRHALKPDSKQ